MRATEIRYPVDRYLVESSKRYDMINIIDDDIWNSEPVLRPEDEIILRKLHDMLQSTADDLKLLSGELTKYHETGVQKKLLPTPLDEDFNEKVHIEEVVNAKFHGLKLDSTEHTPQIKPKAVIDGDIHCLDKNRVKQFINHGVQVNQVQTPKKTSIKRNLKVSRTNIIQIDEKLAEEKTNNKLKNNNVKSVAYNNFTYKYAEPTQISTDTKYKIQQMPSIDIRSELREQKVLQMDIIPNKTEVFNERIIKNNALVIEVKHEDTPVPLVASKPLSFSHIQYIPDVKNASEVQPVRRKVSKMSTYESSQSTNNISSESESNLKKQKYKTSAKLRISPQDAHVPKRESKRPTTNIEKWQRKLNAVYGGSSKLNHSKAKMKKPSPKKTKSLNNAVYIPYSKLTIGGVNVGDIEREISNMPYRNEIVLSPILDQIMSSRENSFHSTIPRENYKNKNPKILTTSDENLLQEVLDIQKQVTRTIAENIENKKEFQSSEINIKHKDNDQKDSDNYDDDFEDENSVNSEQVLDSQTNNTTSQESLPNNSRQDVTYNKNELNMTDNDDIQKQSDTKVHNKTFNKISNLSFKNSIDIFEFVHSVDTQDTGTQSNTIIKISPRGINTSTSSKTEGSNMQPIHNDLWPSIDPRGEVEKMFKEEKEFIQKLILDEYGDLLEKQLNKPSTSRNVDYEKNERNVAASQKNTQTSPAHVKNVTTSPIRTKTRTTSPFALSLTVDQQTSPIIVVSNEDEIKVEIGNDDDLGLSVNLSSPRFSLRLPQTSHDVLSNIRPDVCSNNIEIPKQNNLRKNTFSSSSSGDGDYSSSDISSLGEINKMYKRKLKKSRIPSISDISSSSMSRYSTETSGAIHPLKSEGEASVGQVNRKKSKQNKSEGEVSFGHVN